jgi:hypothetical protein
MIDSSGMQGNCEEKPGNWWECFSKQDQKTKAAREVIIPKMG